jgi:hypothetical protein
VKHLLFPYYNPIVDLHDCCPPSAVRYGRVPKRSKSGEGEKGQVDSNGDPIGGALSPASEALEAEQEQRHLAIYDVILQVQQVGVADSKWRA